MTERTCSARPAALIDYGRDALDIRYRLSAELEEFDLAMRSYVRASGGFLAILRMFRYAHDMWTAVSELEDLAGWVGHVGWAFAVAGAGGDTTTRAAVRADRKDVDALLGPADWTPGAHVRPGAPGDWLRAVNPSCIASGGAGYRGSGFIVGPDGRSYPLVAPWVVRDGVEYHADDGSPPGGPRVLELDGRDPGWTTIFRHVGVERWREEPSAFERLWIGVGATVGGRLKGSTQSDVEQLVVPLGAAPYFAPAPGPSRPSTEPSPPPYMVPTAPDYAPPARPDTTYPGNNRAGAVSNAVPIAIDAMLGATSADQGSHAAYDVMFQQNEDGRVRALYRRVYVGFDENGRAYAQSLWIYGPEQTERVVINYPG